jgi:hypothetical protein
VDVVVLDQKALCITFVMQWFVYAHANLVEENRVQV